MPDGAEREKKDRNVRHNVHYYICEEHCRRIYSAASGIKQIPVSLPWGTSES